MRPDDRVRIQHIADALAAVARFIEGRERQDLDQDDMLRLSLVQAIQIVGEAASKLSSDTRDRHPEIPWASIIGMRHRLVHAYFDIDPEILWTTVTEAAPALSAQIKTILDRA